MKRIIIILFCFFTLHATYAQKENYVTIVASGSGSNEIEAVNVALRNCIEKTYGVFISSSVEIINDEIIKDKISSIGQGTILDYKIISRKNNGKDVTLSAQVSPSKIVKFSQAEGYDVNIKGNVYVQNAIKEEYYKQQEVDILTSFFKQYENIDFFDFKVSISEPYRLLPQDCWKDKFKLYKDYKEHYNSLVKDLTYTFEIDLEDYSVDIPKYRSFPSFWKGYWYNNYPKWKIINSLAGYTGLDEAYKQKNKEYFFKSHDFRIEVLFIPTPNENYSVFINELWGFLDEISIKDIESFNQLVGKALYISNGNTYNKDKNTKKHSSIEEALKCWQIKEGVEGIASFDLTPTSPPLCAITSTSGKKYVIKKSRLMKCLGSNNSSRYALRNNESVKIVFDFFDKVYQQSTSFKFLDAEKINGIDRRKYISVINGRNFHFGKIKSASKLIKSTEIILYPYMYLGKRSSSSLGIQTFRPSGLFIYLTMEELNNLKQLKF